VHFGKYNIRKVVLIAKVIKLIETHSQALTGEKRVLTFFAIQYQSKKKAGVVLSSASVVDMNSVGAVSRNVHLNNL
jgi:hypothetical protein